FVVYHLSQCISALILSVECGQDHVEYRECGTTCPTSCLNKDQPSRMCALHCVSGCFCEGDYIEDGYGRCIHSKYCQ
uniref:TIL domain-containing protein n=1 Tax=Leptobrachium leishanense TaxID=445787 RepID=A0A8C5PXX9_9ANUR